MKERPILFSAPMVRAILDGSKTQTRRVIKKAVSFGSCPFGGLGDQLWVKETFAKGAGDRNFRIFYRADLADDSCDSFKPPKWTPSIFMPRKLSRIQLEVTAVRMQQIQEISSADILAEGVRIPVSEKGAYLLRVTGKHSPAEYLGCKLADASSDDILRAEFAALWDTINAKRGFPWSADPWVWVVEFERIDP